MRKEDKQLLAKLEKQGMEVERTGSGHWKVTRDGRFVTIIAFSRSDWRGFRNKIAELRRAGVAI